MQGENRSAAPAATRLRSWCKIAFEGESVACYWREMVIKPGLSGSGSAQNCHLQLSSALPVMSERFSVSPQKSKREKMNVNSNY